MSFVGEKPNSYACVTDFTHIRTIKVKHFELQDVWIIMFNSKNKNYQSWCEHLYCFILTRTGITENIELGVRLCYNDANLEIIL